MEETDFERGPLSQLSDLDLGSGYTAYRRVSLTDPQRHAKFCSTRKFYLWTDGHLGR